MFAFFKRVMRLAALPTQAETNAAARRDEPKPAIDERALTPASWPAAGQKSASFVWRGGCCG